MSSFRYEEYDLAQALPATWATDLAFIAGRSATERSLKPTSVTSREAPHVRSRPLLLVDGQVLRKEASWLFDLYETVFLDYTRRYAGVQVYTATSDLYAINLNVQWGDGMVYECHVDSNPVQGMLYMSTLTPDDGGALVVALNKDAQSIPEVDEDCIEIYPKANHLVLFDAREAPHYVRPLTRDGARIAVAMNFYTDDCPETDRPEDLSRHLFGPNRG